MTNYLPHSSKKLAILQRREMALFRLIDENVPHKKIVDAAKQVRDARIRTIEARIASDGPQTGPNIHDRYIEFVRNDLALLNSSADKEQEAVRHYGAAIRFDPSEVVFYLNRGGLLVNLGEFVKAIADFTAAIALAPDDDRPYALRYNAHVYGFADSARLRRGKSSPTGCTERRQMALDLEATGPAQWGPA